ncbi:MAG: flagellar hook-basal body protein [Lachnospiraceae bacterium]
MYQSFYTAALGVISQQSKMDIISNNLANASTAGYKSKNAVFSDLMYNNLNAPRDVATRFKAGTGVTVGQVNTNFAPAGFTETGLKNDFAITQEGFFMLENPATQEITYTRDGHFNMSLRGDRFYLVSSNGKLVLDKNRQPIQMSEPGKDINGNVPNIGIYEIPMKNGMQNIGDNEYQTVAKNGQPVLLEDAVPKQGALEVSGIDMGTELARVIEAQRAYSYALKMVQTSDEITTTINTLR